MSAVDYFKEVDYFKDEKKVLGIEFSNLKSLK